MDENLPLSIENDPNPNKVLNDVNSNKKESKNSFGNNNKEEEKSDTVKKKDPNNNNKEEEKSDTVKEKTPEDFRREKRKRRREAKAESISKKRGLFRKTRTNIGFLASDLSKSRFGKTLGKARKLTVKSSKNIFVLSLKALKFLLLNLTKIIIAIIIITIIIFTFKKILNLWKKYPRLKFINGYLDIASKFDKSTGLDIEMANILSKSLTDYIKRPNDIINNLKDNDYKNYIKDNLFQKFNYESDLCKLLQKFIKYRNDVLKLGYNVLSNPKDNNSNIKHIEFLEGYFSKNTEIPPGLNVSPEGLDIPETNTAGDGFLSIFLGESPASFNINSQFQNDPTALAYIMALKDFPDTNPDIFNLSYQDIKKVFSDILKTSHNEKDKNEFYNNIFYRNVLYIIILDYENDIVNKNGDGQLQLIERNNPLSYINPDITYKVDEPIYELYGKYLHMPNSVGSNSIKTFKKIFSKNIIDSNIQGILNNASANYNDKFKNGPNSLTGIYDILRNDIDTYINNFLKQDILNNRYEFIFDKLNDNFTDEIDIKTDNYDWNDIYEKYKLELNKNKYTNYNSGNKKINELYNFNDENENVVIDDKYNINKVDNKTKSLLEIFNILIIFDDFKENYNNFENDDLYDKLIEYLWSFEYFTTLTYYNTIDTKYEFLFEDNKKKKLLNNYHNALRLSLYFRDKDIINSVCYLNIIYRQKNPSDNELNIIRNNFLDISSYYLSFMEIKLFANFINDVKEYKEKRTGFDIQNDYWFPKVSYLWKNIIKNEIIDRDFTITNIYRTQKVFYTPLRNFLGEQCNFIFTPKVRKLWGCSEEYNLFEQYKEKYNNKRSNKKDKNDKDIEEKFLLLGALSGGLKKLGILKPLEGILKKIVNFLIKQINKIPIVKNALTIILFVVKIIKNIGAFGLDGILFLIICLLLFIVATILKYLCLTTPEFGVATIIFGLLVVPFILILILIKSSIILIIIAVISIICLTIIILDNVIEKMLENNNNGQKENNNKQPMAHINVVSKLIYKNFLSCENSPHSWYKNSRYDLENKSSRGFFCNKPCASNYRLSDDKSFCEKAPTNVPYYCPQPLLFRYFRKETVYGKNYIQDFSAESHPLLLLNNNSIQTEYINKYNQNKKEYYNSCQNIDKDNYKNYNIIGKNVCAYGLSKNPNINGGENENIKSKIKQICKQTYCENGKYESFCYKYDDDAFKPEEIIKDNNKFTKYLKILILGIILYSLCIYIINSVNSIIINKKIDNPFTPLGINIKNLYNNMRFGMRFDKNTINKPPVI